jgi:uncharacterized protein (DUF608 family)
MFKDFYLNCVAFPLGGLGTGNIALAGDGSLRQWQIVNNVNHLGYVPSSFFFIQTRLAESGNWVTKILEKDVKIPDDFKPAESVNDHIIPDDIKARHENFNCFQDIELEGKYPFAKTKYDDDEIPVEIKLEAWNPMIPLDVKNSALPIIIFNFEIRNPNKETSVDIRLGGTLLNFIGWDGISEIDLNFYPNFYANKNRKISLNNTQGIEMISESTVLEDMLQGEIIFASMHKDCLIFPSVASLNNFPEILDTLNSDINQPSTAKASSHGKTWIGILLNKLTLGPLEKKNVIFLLGWSFPNRYLNWDNRYYRRVGVDTKSKFWLGNRYNKWFRHAKDVIQYTVDNFEFLEKTTREFQNLLFNTTIPEEIIESISATMSTVRTPSCFMNFKGEFMGFEGCCGESTALNTSAYGGCCPMNCTHVWNYSVTHSRLYPSLEISMLNNEFMRVGSKGLLPHRLVVPTYLPQANDVRIGGPVHPAMDGLFGCILKTYRMLLFTNDFEWFKKAYPKIRRLMNYVFQECDPDAQGVIEGEQPNTYDISFYGKNMFIGALYLAALKAFEKMANLVYDDDFKEKCIKRLNNGKKNYDDSLWNGEYWIQTYDEKKHHSSQYGIGCLSDQLFGQFWAYMLELGSLLPKEKINITLDSIMKYNFMENFHGFVQKSRIFASEHDKGLLICSWPKGKRPKIPMGYSDEVWTGIEYEVAALMMENDKIDSALKILNAIRDRYDGRYRNPWNEVECGDHYVRAMSSWRIYEAAIGYHWNALENRINFLPRFKNNPMQALFITNSSWGMIRREYDGNNLSITIKPLFGELNLKILRTWNLEESIDHIFEVSIDGLSLKKDNVDINVLNDIIEIKFKENLQIASNQELNVKLKSEK